MKILIRLSFVSLLTLSFSFVFADSKPLAEGLAEEMYRAERNPKVNRIALNRFMFHPEDKELPTKIKQMSIVNVSGEKCILSGIQGGVWGAKADYNKAYLQKMIEGGVTTWVLKGVDGGMGDICSNNEVFKSDKDKQFVPVEVYELNKLQAEYAKYSCLIKVGSELRKLTDKEATEIALCNINPDNLNKSASDQQKLYKHRASFKEKIEADPAYKTLIMPEQSLYCGKFILEDESKNQQLQCTDSFVKMIGFGTTPGRVENGFCTPRRKERYTMLCPINTQPKGFQDENYIAFFTTGPGDCRAEHCTQVKASTPIASQPVAQPDAPALKPIAQ